MELLMGKSDAGMEIDQADIPAGVY